MKKILTLLLLSSCSLASYAQADNAPNGSIAPNITITSVDSVEHSLYDYTAAGKFVLIDFFAYWCGPCKDVAPILQDFYIKYGCNTGDIVVLGNEADGSALQLHAFEMDAGLDTTKLYPTGAGLEFDNEDNVITYGINAYPTIVLIDTNNKVVNNDVWPITSLSALENRLAGLGLNLSPMSCEPTAVQDTDLKRRYTLYPNPSQGKILHVSGEGILSWTLSDLTGRVIMTEQYSSRTEDAQIETLSLEPGVYILRLSTTQGPVSYSVMR